MQKEKVVVFIEDGLVTCSFASNPNIEIEAVSFDHDLDNTDELNRLFDECSKNMTPIQERIIHP